MRPICRFQVAVAVAGALAAPGSLLASPWAAPVGPWAGTAGADEGAPATTPPAIRPAKPATADDLDFRPGLLQLVTDQPSGGRFLVFTYVIANKTGKTQRFLPRFDLLFGDGAVRQAGSGVMPEVSRRLQRACASAQSMDQFQIMGDLADGESNARDGFVVWEIPAGTDLKDVTLFVTGTSAAFDRDVDASGKATITRRTWVRDYRFRGTTDPAVSAAGEFDPIDDRWIMR
jgi:hypothetical protein